MTEGQKTEPARIEELTGGELDPKIADVPRPWVSPEDRRGAPEIGALRVREMVDPPPIAALAKAELKETAREGMAEPGGTSRRDFAKLLGLGLAAAGCSRAPVQEAIPFVDKPVEMTPGVALHYATTCAGCSAACPVVVKTRDGRAIKLEGNRLAPETGGGTCAVGQATVLSLYDEGRFRGPRWRGEETSWEDLDRRMVRHLAAARSAGGRIAVVTDTVVSPTSRQLLEELVAAYDARWVSWDPVSGASIRRAHEAILGVPTEPAIRFGRVRAVVGLEADFLGTGPAPVEHARGYARARRLPDSPDGSRGEAGILWHGQIESRLSLTGANADLRVPVDVSQVGAAAVALYDRVLGLADSGSQRAPSPPRPGVPEEALDLAAKKLWRNRGAALVVSGLADPAVQQVVCALNLLLGSYGRTLDLERPSRSRQGDEEELAELIASMRRGEVHVLLLWGVNPLYSHAQADDFRTGLEEVTLTVSFAGRPDETTEWVDVVAPDHHFLESWNDAEPVAGRLQLSQPAMAPLFDTRAAQESLLVWMGREPDWRAYLEERWHREVFPLQSRWQDPTTFWHRALQDGIVDLEGSAPGDGYVSGRSETAPVAEPAGEAAVATARDAVLAEAAAARDRRDPETFDLALYEKVALRDGRWAHVPWLQELPDPISRVTWGNYAALAPVTAERLDVEEGDEVRVAVNGTAVELPVQIQPGQAPGTVAVALGYGRRSAGPVAEGVGGNAFGLVDASRGLFRYHRSGVTVTATGRRSELAATQHHYLLEGRPFVHETTFEAWRRDPDSAHPGQEASHGGGEHHGDADRHGGAGSRGSGLPDLWQERPELGYSWGMAVDLHACIGCGACVVACQAENNVPVVGAAEVRRGREMHWLRIDRYYRGSLDRPDTVFQPMMCQHCDHAPCETVCPVLATVHSSDGLNQQIYNRCVGTRYCANNCPYKVRRFNWFNYARNERFDYHLNSDLGAMVLNPDVTVRSRGVMEKCSLCIQRVQEGKLAARDEGRRVRDGDILTACQQACPTDALTFGDWLDPESRLSRLGRDPRFYRVLDELGIRPSSGYLAKVRHRQSGANPAAHPGIDSEKEA